MTDRDPQTEELDLRAYFRPVWHRKWLVLLILVVAAAGTYAISSRQAKSYVTSSEIFVSVSDPTAAVNGAVPDTSPSTTDLANIAQLITTQATVSDVRSLVGPKVAASGSVTAVPSSSSSFVTVTATSSNPRTAASLANAYVDAFISARRQSVVTAAQSSLTAARASRKTLAKSSKTAAASAAVSSEQSILEQQIVSSRAALADPSPGAQQVQMALPPGAPVSPNPKRDAVFGGVVGLVLAIIAAFSLELVDRRLSSVDGVETIFGNRVLAVLPHVRDPTPMLSGERPVVPAAFLEQLRSLTVILKLAASSKAPKTLMVTSTLPREGKSTVTRDLAIIYAEAGNRVLVIDCDLRRPSVERLFGIEPRPGLVHALRDGRPLAELTTLGASVASRDAADGTSAGSGEAGTGLRGTVDVLTHGEIMDSPLALMSSERMTALLREASESYDMVLVDTPPVLVVADAVPLLSMVDGVLVVARLGQTTRAAARHFTELIERVGDVNFFGVIANDRRVDVADGYGSYGHYGYKADNEKVSRRGSKRKPDPPRAATAAEVRTTPADAEQTEIVLTEVAAGRNDGDVPDDTEQFVPPEGAPYGANAE
jgi:succinoglycan biosynthesis transport protein ExoP